jgi:hypothetical protein
MPETPELVSKEMRPRSLNSFQVLHTPDAAALCKVVPDLEAGNMLAKQLSFLAGAEAAGVVLGARVPIILTSRADSARTRLASCALAVLMARNVAAVAA